MTQLRLKAADRKKAIITAVIALSQEKTYSRVTRAEISKHLKISGPAVQHHFGTMEHLRVAVMRAAVKRGATGDDRALKVVSQGLAHGDPVALAAPSEVRRNAVWAML